MSCRYQNKDSTLSPVILRSCVAGVELGPTALRSGTQPSELTYHAWRLRTRTPLFCFVAASRWWLHRHRIPWDALTESDEVEITFTKEWLICGLKLTQIPLPPLSPEVTWPSKTFHAFRDKRDFPCSSLTCVTADNNVSHSSSEMLLFGLICNHLDSWI